MNSRIRILAAAFVFSAAFTYPQTYSYQSSGGRNTYTQGSRTTGSSGSGSSASGSYSANTKNSVYGTKKHLAPVTYNTSRGPRTFKFKYRDGDSYKIHSIVNEDVFVNRQFSHNAEIVNRISVQVDDVKEDGSARNTAEFVTSENSTGSRTGTFTWGEEYKSIFYRDAQGVYDIGDQYFMPVVRDVPVFPKKELSPGDVWTYNGHEAHDLRRGFNLQTPYKVPFTATYTYLGTIDRQKKTSTLGYAAQSVNTLKNQDKDESEKDILHVFSVKYALAFDSSEIGAGNSPSYDDYPVSTLGFSDQMIYWDNAKGCIDHYNETFRILIETAFGDIFEFTGTASAEVTDFIRTSTDDDEAKVKAQLEQMGLENVNVKKGDKGLTISIEDIKFKADSAVLLDSEKVKLQQIAEILKAYPDNDILVTGHTALAGTVSKRQQLSEERAAEVASYLIDLGVKDKYHIFTKGYGATRPVANNTTEEGKAKNRRVEITIMDK